MYDLATSITVSGKKYHITNDGDFRVILDCFEALNDEELSKEEKVIACLIIFYEDFDIDTICNLGQDLETAVREMYKFFNCGEEESVGMTTPHQLIDWNKDSQLIMSAVNNVAGKEIRAEKYVHWWTFIGYYMAIGDCPLANIVSIRNKIVSGKKLEKYEREFKQHNPQYFIWDAKTVEEKEADKLAREIWNSQG